jgi:riboflavin transporter FmnP
LNGDAEMKFTLLKMTRIAVLSAVSIVLMLLVRFPIIPAASFLEYEPADVAILIGGFIYGPLAGLVLTAIVSIVQALTVSANGGWVGLVMHIISTGTLTVVASIIYRKIKGIKGAIVGLIAGSIAMTLVMIPANLFFTVKFYGVPYEAVKALIPAAIIPFNLIKSIANSIIVLAIFKPLKRILTPETK